MFRTFCKKLPLFFFSMTIGYLLFAGSLLASIIPVTSTDGGQGPGTLNEAIQIAQDGDIIDCSPIAGQTIYVSNPRLPGITSSATILGSGVIIDGGSEFPAFCVAQGSPTITDFVIQNTLSQGGAGGHGFTGGGGGTGGGGALYVHSGSTLTISTLSLNNNQAVGGAGGAGNTGGSGGGGGGFGGGAGGVSTHTGSTAGAGGGGGGNNGGALGGAVGAGESNSFANHAGAGGGGEIPSSTLAGAGGTVAATDVPTPAYSGGGGGASATSHGGGAGGGAGGGGSGSHGSDATTNEGGNGGNGGPGIGVDYGAGGGGGGGNGGGAGRGTSGGGGGFNGPGGFGGSLGGGGGASTTSVGGNGGFGAGGGGARIGGIDTYGLGGAGGSANAPAGGGGGSGLGGAIFIQKGGTLVMLDGVTLSGNSTTAGIGGTAAGSSGGNGSSLGQDIFIQAGANATFQIDNALTLSNPIEGAGLLSEVRGPGVIKSGTGILNLVGANTYLGGTFIQSGTLNLNGSILGDLYIVSSGTLSGNATVNGNIYHSGTISPGNSIGETFTTDLYLYPTSIYNVEINAAGDNDLITASGFAQIAGGVVVTPDDVNFTAPLTYTIISTSTGVTGQFSSLTSSVPSLMSLIYNPLTVQITYLPLDPIGLTCNALNAANCFVTLPALPGSDAATINNALLALSFDSIQCAFDQMSPAQFSGPTEVQLLDAILVRTTYTKHLQTFCFNKDRHSEQPFSLWIDGIAQWQKQGEQFGYKDTTLGATIGVDYAIRNGVFGLAFSATDDKFHWKDFAGKVKINSFYGGLYGRWNGDAFYLNAALIGAYNKYNAKRQICFGTIDRCADSQHHGNEWLPHLGLGYQFSPSRFQLIPYLNLDYVLLHEQNYTECGAGSLNLQVNSKNARLFQADAGITFNTTYHTSHGSFIPMLTLAYINQTPTSSKNYCANFVNSCCTFTGKGGNYERNLFVPRLAFMYQDTHEGVNAAIYYDGQVGSKYWAQDIVLDVMFRF